FALKSGIVFLVALGVFLHFYAGLKGYWLAHPRRANAIGAAVGALALIAVASGFFIIGTPGDIRMLRYDEQKVNDLQSIQWQVVNHYQQKGALPVDLSYLDDPISSYM